MGITFLYSQEVVLRFGVSSQEILGDFFAGTTYLSVCRMVQTRAGNTRYDGKTLEDVPKPSDLPGEV